MLLETFPPRAEFRALLNSASVVPVGARILAGLGVNDLSMSAQDIAAVKTVLRAETLSAMQLLAQRALAAGSASEVRAL